jgi:hypothetical protein
MAQHSNIVGGSAAKRVINCPGSVALVAKAPAKPSSVYADTGTLIHNVIADVLGGRGDAQEFLGTTYAGMTLDQDLIDTKLLPALAALNDIDPDKQMEFETEVVVSYGDILPGVFGSADIVGRIGDTAYIIDWKFGDGVAVEVEENPQLLFYAAAARRTPAARWAFEGATKVELVIVQPPHVKRWLTTPERVQMFEGELARAVRIAERPDAPLAVGDWCRWCAAKAMCPLMTGAADRAMVSALEGVDVARVSEYLKMSDQLEGWIKEVRSLAMQTLESGLPVPGYKLVPKRGRRQWVDEAKAFAAMCGMGLEDKELTETTILSPAAAEKVLKKYKLALPEGHVVSVSSGNTLATEEDPRPAALQIGRQLSAALGKII